MGAAGAGHEPLAEASPKWLPTRPAHHHPSCRRHPQSRETGRQEHRARRLEVKGQGLRHPDALPQGGHRDGADGRRIQVQQPDRSSSWTPQGRGREAGPAAGELPGHAGSVGCHEPIG